MKIRILVFFFLVLVCSQLDAFPGCGDEALAQNLTHAATRAATWLSENLIDETSETEGYILSAAFHSLKLVDYPLRKSLTNHPKSNIYKDFDVAGTPIWRVALYTQGYIATCRKPKKVFIDRLKTGIKRCCKANFRNPFQYMTTALALCNSRRPFKPQRIQRILKFLLSDDYKYSSIDTVAMATIALSCVKRKQRGFWARKISKYTRKIKPATKWLLKRQNADGSFGKNGITTALATQAILSNKNWAELKWQCSKTMKYLLSQQKEDGSFGDLISTIQILPVLKGKVPYDLEPRKCSVDNSTQTIVNSTDTLVEEKPLVNVCLKIQFSETDKRRFDVQVKQGSTVHEIFKTAKEQHKDQFTFQATETKYGAMIRSICGRNEALTDRIHWMMYTSPATMATVGVDGLRPENGTCVIFKLMKTGDESLPCRECGK